MKINRKETEMSDFKRMDQILFMGSQIKSVSDHVCQKWDILELQKQLWEGKVPHESRKLLNGKERYPMMKQDGKVPRVNLYTP